MTKHAFHNGRPHWPAHWIWAVTARASRWFAFALVMASLALPAKADGLLSASEEEALRNLFAGAKRQEWQWAQVQAARIDDPIAAVALEWLYVTSAREDVPFARIVRFMERYPHWPSQQRLQIRAEETIDSLTADLDILTFFDAHAPITRQGRVRYAEGLLRADRTDEAITWLRRSWIDDNYSSSEQGYVLNNYGEYLRREDHIKRLDRLLWDQRLSEAERMQPLVPRDQWRLADARIHLQRKMAGVDGAIERVPAGLRDDPGLLFDRIRWRRERGLHDGAVELLNQAPRHDGHGQLWWRERALQAREAMDAGDYLTAYRLVAGHKRTEPAQVAEAEWLAGWLALRFIDRPQEALKHFEALYASVSRPISLARGAYWAGRAAAALGDESGALAWFRKAAIHDIAFYGQLAAQELDEHERPAYEPPRPPSDEHRLAFAERDLVRLTRMLLEADLEEQITPFVGRLADDSATATDFLLVTELLQESNRWDLQVRIGKRASWRGVVVERAAFPVPDVDALIDDLGDGVDPPLVLAIGRQESEFNYRAISPAGARGLLQLMPPTAKAVAQRERLLYSPDRLVRDANYNARLGRRYIGDLLEMFDGDVVLAVAAYNAGPGRVNQWLERFGDPRRTNQIDLLDWIELMPFAETRNYVQRVLEARHVYRRQLSGAQAAAVTPPTPHYRYMRAPEPRLKPRDST